MLPHPPSPRPASIDLTACVMDLITTGAIEGQEVHWRVQRKVPGGALTVVTDGRAFEVSGDGEIAEDCPELIRRAIVDVFVRRIVEFRPDFEHRLNGANPLIG